MWANRSGHSPKMSDVSKSLRSLTKNERMSESLVFLSESIIRSFFRRKRPISSENRKRIPSPACWWFLHRIWTAVFFNPWTESIQSVEDHSSTESGLRCGSLLNSNWTALCITLLDILLASLILESPDVGLGSRPYSCFFSARGLASVRSIRISSPRGSR